MAESISAVIPYRNRELEPFKVCLHSMQYQARPFDEIIMVDIASDDEYRYPMEDYCKSHGVDYHYLDIDASATAIEVFLWHTCHNYGFRLAKSDLISTTGCDRIYERNLVKQTLKVFNDNKRRTGRDMVTSTKVRNLYRTPTIKELDDFNKLATEAKWRGGYGFLCVPRLWFNKIHGIDEQLRWYEDIDMAIRTKQDGLYFRYISGGGISGPAGAGEFRMLHMVHVGKHKKKKRKSYGKNRNVLEVAQRGKRYCRGGQPTIRNDENWGRLTPEKIAKAIKLAEG